MGGCGLLENYPGDSGIAARVHSRNRSMAQAMDAAYNAYLNEYVAAVEATESVQALHDLGPPLTPYRFPSPAGISSDQLLDIIEDQDTTSFRAWKAVSQKLAKLEQRHSAGSMFFRAKFEYANEVKSPVGGGAGKVAFNFDIGSDGYLEKSATTVETAVGPNEVEIPGRKAKVTAQVKREIDVNTGAEKDTLVLGLKRGNKGYGFESSSDGNVKFTGPYNTYSEFNSRTAEGGFGFCLKLSDLLDSDEEPKSPEQEDFIEAAPDAQFCLGLHFVLLREDQVLSYLVRAPGFFERRLLSDLLGCNWHSLSAFEQAQLTVIGWAPETWDRRAEDDFPPATGKDYSQLDAATKIAAVKLGFHQMNWASTWLAEKGKASARLTEGGAR